MDTEVYLICPVCETITEGVGSGDLTDSIRCKKCNKSFKSVSSFQYNNYMLDKKGFMKFKGKRLYCPCDLKFC